jgi:hypothetical protein
MKIKITKRITSRIQSKSRTQSAGVLLSLETDMKARFCQQSKIEGTDPAAEPWRQACHSPS